VGTREMVRYIRPTVRLSTAARQTPARRGLRPSENLGNKHISGFVNIVGPEGSHGIYQTLKLTLMGFSPGLGP
jgi:hypothetical protein